MPDWTKSMQQTYEYYVVDPDTWKDVSLVDTIVSTNIDWDLSSSTLGSAKITTTDSMDECYIRVYLKTVQNGVTERRPLGTFLIQTPSIDFDGRISKFDLDAYTPLIELKEKQPPIGYSVLKGEAIMEVASNLIRENMRAPITQSSDEKRLETNFVANIDDTWMSFLSDLVGRAEFSIGLDEMAGVIFEKNQDIASMQPVWTYTDDNSSILYPAITDERDLYGIPNVVEVIYSTETSFKVSVIENNDESSPISIPRRGRRIIYRDSSPSLMGTPSQAQLDEYAVQLLRNLSCLEHTITYTHGYCPVRIGDCVRLDYKAAGLENVKARVISQSIQCVPGCPVEETAVYTTELWSHSYGTI